MPSCSAWDVVKVPFPYVEQPVHQHRPALVVSSPDLAAKHGLLWVLMITSAENRRWNGDVMISDLDAAGLPVPSVVRCTKIATIEARTAERLGKLPAADQRSVTRNLRQILKATSVR